MNSWILRHWRGELGPGASWWLNGVGVSALLWFSVARAAELLGIGSADTLARFAAVLALQWFQVGLVPLWQMVGLWRCGNRLALLPDRWLRGRATQVAAFIFTTLITMQGLVVGAEQVIGARVALALGSYSYTVSLGQRGREITVTGGLGFGVSAAVGKLLAANPQVRRIRLNSGGGALSEGTKLRALVLAHDLDTYTSVECSSACVSAFAGGRFRFLQRGARIGLHLPRNWDAFSRGGVAASYRGELKYFHDRGLPDWFLDRWVRTGRKFWYPTEFQLISSGLVTQLRGQPPELVRR